MAYIPDTRAAVTLALADGTSFTFPNNGTQLVDTAQGNIAQRVTTDGWVTQPLPTKPQTYHHEGITGPEGLDPWLTAQAAFINQRCVYADKLTRKTKTVVITAFAVRVDGQHPRRATWIIDATEAPQYTPQS